MVGVMLVAGSKRHLVIADGMPACAALMVASRIAPAVTDYCVYCRSHSHHGLDHALSLFQAIGAARTRHGKHRRHRRHPGLAAGARCRRAADRGGRGRRRRSVAAGRPMPAAASARVLTQRGVSVSSRHARLPRHRGNGHGRRFTLVGRCRHASGVAIGGARHPGATTPGGVWTAATPRQRAPSPAAAVPAARAWHLRVGTVPAERDAARVTDCSTRSPSTRRPPRRHGPACHRRRSTPARCRRRLARRGDAEQAKARCQRRLARPAGAAARRRGAEHARQVAAQRGGDADSHRVRGAGRDDAPRRRPQNTAVAATAAQITKAAVVAPCGDYH